MSAPVQPTGPARIRLAGLALCVLLGAAGCSANSPAQGYRDVTADRLHTRMQQADAAHDPFIIVDVRTAREYRTGHIRGAVLIPVDTLNSHLDEIPKDRDVYVYCQGGVRSARAARLLAADGYTRIQNMLGGITAWNKAGYEVIRP